MEGFYKLINDPALGSFFVFEKPREIAGLSVEGRMHASGCRSV